MRGNHSIIKCPAPPRSHLAAFAEKRGGGTRLFGSTSWKSRWFVIDKAQKGLAYFEHQKSAAALKPPIRLTEYSLTYDDGAVGGYFEVSARHVVGCARTAAPCHDSPRTRAAHTRPRPPHNRALQFSLKHTAPAASQDVRETLTLRTTHASERAAFVEALGRTALAALSKPAFTHLYPSARDKVSVLLEMWGFGDSHKQAEVARRPRKEGRK